LHVEPERRAEAVRLLREMGRSDPDIHAVIGPEGGVQ
jgi:hypothetical protein